MKSFLKPNESQSQSLLQRAKKRKLVLESPMKKSSMKKTLYMMHLKIYLILKLVIVLLA